LVHGKVSELVLLHLLYCSSLLFFRVHGTWYLA
jgi:hypothetical protein